MARVAVLVADGFDEHEFRVAGQRLREAGHDVIVAGAHEGDRIWSADGTHSTRVDTAAGHVAAKEFDALVIPGGRAPASLRRDRAVVDFVRRFAATGRLVAAICTGLQLLTEAGAVAGRTLTSSRDLRSDVTDAGAAWIDATVVLEGNLVTSRQQQDIAHFCNAVLSRLRDAEPER